MGYAPEAGPAAFNGQPALPRWSKTGYARVGRDGVCHGACANHSSWKMRYMPHMTKIEEAINKVRELPEAEQKKAAEMLLSVASKRGEPVRLDDETRAAIREGREQARRGELVSEEDMAAFFKRHGVNRSGA